MKHYEIKISANAHDFEYKCSTISEAYDAICDASAVFGIKVELDTVMEKLVDMKNGNLQKTTTHRVTIAVADGEV